VPSRAQSRCGESAGSGITPGDPFGDLPLHTCVVEGHRIPTPFIFFSRSTSVAAAYATNFGREDGDVRKPPLDMPMVLLPPTHRSSHPLILPTSQVTQPDLEAWLTYLTENGWEARVYDISTWHKASAHGLFSRARTYAAVRLALLCHVCFVLI
jgi:hypothetical protein